MLRLLALALLLAPLAQAQTLFGCPPDAEFEDIGRVMDPEPFAVWDDLAGFRDDGSMRVCPGTPPGDTEEDAPAMFHSIDEEGSLLLDAVVNLDGRPLPFAIVIASTREERDGPIEIAAVGVADRNGVIRMVLPPAQNALRLTSFPNRKQNPEAPAIASLLDEDMSSAAHENPVFVGTSDANLNVLMASAAGPGEEPQGPYLSGGRTPRIHFRRAMRTALVATMRLRAGSVRLLR